MHPREVPALVLLDFETLLDLDQHVVFVLLRSAVLGQACHCRLRGVPVPLPILVEMRGLIGEAPQGIPEDGEIFAGLHDAQLDLAFGKPSIRAARIGSRAQVDRTRHAAGGGVTSQVGVLVVDAQGQRARFTIPVQLTKSDGTVTTELEVSWTLLKPQEG